MPARQPGRQSPAPDEKHAVLIVDDRAENLLALEALLESLPVRTVRAMSATEALERVAEEQFALILLDVQMPGTDGLEAARLIKEREHGSVVPILFVTAQDRDRRRVTTAYAAGAVDYMFKPLDPDELRAKVSAFLDLHQMHARDRDRRRRYADQIVSASEDRYREAADAAQHALAALQVADRSKTDFLSRMSHEFKTPLNAILGYVQLLDLGILGAVTPEQHVHLNRVRQSAVHLLGIVNEILDLVILESAQLRVARVVGNLGEVCDAAHSLVRLEAALRQLTVVDLSAGEPGAAYVGDPDRVRQVLVHLLTNAVKFTPPGGRVTLSCGTSSEANPDPDAPALGTWSYIRVTDTGPGIALEQLTRIFEAFTQVDTGLTRAQEGAGLGLAISRRLARTMGGDVTVRSEPPNGAAFTLWLPSSDALAVLQPPDATPAGDDAPAATQSRETGDGRPLASVRDGAAVVRESAAARSSTYQHLAALGTTVVTEIETIVQQHVARLRADRSLPNVDHLSDLQLRDHVGTLVNEIAHVLRVTGETEGQTPEILRDGSEILRIVSELHGAQRERLDWGEQHITSEVESLRCAIGERLQLAASEGATDMDALAQAMLLVHRLLEQSQLASLRGFRVGRRVRAAP